MRAVAFAQLLACACLAGTGPSGPPVPTPGPDASQPAPVDGWDYDDAMPLVDAPVTPAPGAETQAECLYLGGDWVCYRLPRDPVTYCDCHAHGGDL